MFKIKIYIDNEAIIKANSERFDDFEPLLDKLRLKFGDKRRRNNGQ